MSTLNKVIIVVILLVLAGCAPQVDTEKERAAILQTDKEWVTAASEGRDLERIISFWADDAAIYPPGLPSVVGKEAIRQFIGKSLQTPLVRPSRPMARQSQSGVKNRPARGNA